MAQLLQRAWVRLVARVDGVLMLLTLTLMATGLATVYSATADSSSRLFAQALNMAIGLTVMWMVAQLPPQKLMRFGVPLYLAGVVLLVLVFLFGIKVNGARRWLSLGFTRIQPAELLKIAMPLMLAWYFHKHEAALKARHYAVACLLLLLPFALIAKQPDLGTAILVGAAGFYVIFLAGLPWKVIIGLLAAGAAAAPFAWTMLHDYQRKRILTRSVPAITSSSRPSPSVPVAASARAGWRGRRPTSSSFPNATPTSSSPSMRKREGCSATPSCCSSTCC